MKRAVGAACAAIPLAAIVFFLLPRGHGKGDGDPDSASRDAPAASPALAVLVGTRREAPPTQVAPTPTEHTVSWRGAVLDPSGTPVVGAQVGVWGHSDPGATGRGSCGAPR